MKPKPASTTKAPTLALAISAAFWLAGLVATPACGQTFAPPPIPRYTPPPTPSFRSPPIVHFSPPPTSSRPQPLVVPQVPYPAASQARDQMNLNQMLVQQRQTQDATVAANRQWQFQRDREEALRREVQTGSSMSLHQTVPPVYRAAPSAGSRSVQSPPTRIGAVPISRSTGSGPPAFNSTTRFNDAPTNCAFYFPNDPERRYRWLKVSSTMARNLVNGRTAFLPVGTTVLVAPSGPYSSSNGGQPGFQPRLAPVSAGARNTLRIRNPNEYSAQVGIRSDNQTASLYVEPNSSATAELPDGTYHVFFRFSDRPGKSFQGDDVSLHGSAAEIQLVSVADGNYGLREAN